MGDSFGFQRNQPINSALTQALFIPFLILKLWPIAGSLRFWVNVAFIDESPRGPPRICARRDRLVVY